MMRIPGSRKADRRWPSKLDVYASPARRQGGFTLIEVLVVVAIIALLAAILLPALSRARNLAMVATCKANSKQIGTAVATYQAEYNGHAPVIFNAYASVYGLPARTILLSVALRMYDKGTARLATKYGGQYDPEAVWNYDTQMRYEQQVSPEHFVCPFARGKGPLDTIDHPNQGSYRVWEYVGRYETYGTWMWEGDIVRGQLPISSLGEEVYPTDPQEGRPKYSTLSWNQGTANGILSRPGRAAMVPPNALNMDDPSNMSKVKNLHRKWSNGDAKRVHSTLSDATIVFCSRGNFLALGRQIVNPRSHLGSTGGGTNAIFADTHVEWVKGTQIGWP